MTGAWPVSTTRLSLFLCYLIFVPWRGYSSMLSFVRQKLLERYRLSSQCLDCTSPANERESGGERPITSLRIVGGLRDGEQHLLTGVAFTIGRAPDNDLQLDDPMISRRHLEIEWVQGSYYLRDTGSKNGTLVDGQRVSEIKLIGGESLIVGSTALLFEMFPRSAALDPEDPSEPSVHQSSRTSHSTSMRRLAKVGIAVVLATAVLLGLSTLGVWLAAPPAEQSADLARHAALGIPSRQAQDSRFAILLMGYGGAGHEGAYLTDSMMVAVVDPVQRSVALLSVPRDLWVPLAFSERTKVNSKLNTAYAYAMDSGSYPDRLAEYRGKQGAATFAMDTVSRVLGIPMSYYLTIDFAGFRQMIDSVGGIDIDVPEAFSANYPANDDPSIDPSWTVVKFDKGMEHMDGERAIRYARAREVIDNPAEGTDFARSQRQRLIIEALRGRLTQPSSLIHLPQFLAAVSGNTETNYGGLPSLGMALASLEWWQVKVYQAGLTNQNYLADATGPEGTYILVPDSQGHSWAQVQALVRRLWSDPEAGAAMAGTQTVVENCSGVTGLAARVSQRLADLGYQVGTPSTGAVRGRSTIVSGDDRLGHVLARAMGSDLGISLDEERTQSERPIVTLRIGTDGANLTNLPSQ